MSTLATLPSEIHSLIALDLPLPSLHALTLTSRNLHTAFTAAPLYRRFFLQLYDPPRAPINWLQCLRIRCRFNCSVAYDLLLDAVPGGKNLRILEGWVWGVSHVTAEQAAAGLGREGMEMCEAVKTLLLALGRRESRGCEWGGERVGDEVLAVVGKRLSYMMPLVARYGELGPSWGEWGGGRVEEVRGVPGRWCAYDDYSRRDGEMRLAVKEVREGFRVEMTIEWGRGVHRFNAEMEVGDGKVRGGVGGWREVRAERVSSDGSYRRAFEGIMLPGNRVIVGEWTKNGAAASLFVMWAVPEDAPPLTDITFELW